MTLVIFWIVSALLTGCLASDSLRFLVVGDSGGSPVWPYSTDVERTVANQMNIQAQKYGTSFNLMLGDNFYIFGVKDVEDKRFQETFEKVFSGKYVQNPWYILAGNHDHYGNASAQIAYSKVSKRWNFPNYYYKIDGDIPGGGKVEIIMLDTVLLCGNTPPDFMRGQPQGPDNVKAAEDQWAWLEQQLKTSLANYLIVAGHFPIWSLGDSGPTACLVERLDPMLYKYNVTTFLAGHDHNLQHLQTSKGSQKMDYFVIGPANFVTYNKDKEGKNPKNSSKFYWADILRLGGFAYMEASPKSMTLTFIDGKGAILYQHVMLPRK